MPLLFTTCKKEDEKSSAPPPSSNAQSVYSVVDITNSPNANDTYNFNVSGSMTGIQVPNGSLSYTSDAYELDYLSGGTFQYLVSLTSTNNIVVGCADIEIRTYHNNNLINTENFQMGYTQVSPTVYCDNLVANNSFLKWLSIIAD